MIRQALAETLAPLAAALLKTAGKCDSPEVQPAKAEIMTKCLKIVADLLVDEVPQVAEAACEALVALSSQWEPGQINAPMITIVLGLAHSEEEEEHRAAAAELLGRLAEAFGGTIIEMFAIKAPTTTPPQPPPCHASISCAHFLVSSKQPFLWFAPTCDRSLLAGRRSQRYQRIRSSKYARRRPSRCQR